MGHVKCFLGGETGHMARELHAFLTSVPFFLTFSFLWFYIYIYIYIFFLLLFCLSIYYYYFCNMQLLSFLFFLSSLAIVYNCICIDVFCRFITC